jgi:Na+/proline symporter
MPSAGPLGLPALTLVALFGFRWIEQVGMGQYVAQRLIATKNPLSAVYAAMIWGVGFFAVVPLPWIVTVCAAKVVLPDLVNGDEAYPRMAMLLPTGLKGVLIASMLAAFMSTYSSLLSWGSSYVINDLYRRFLVKNASERHYVRAGQVYMIPMVLIAGALTLYADSLLNIIFVVLSVMSGYWTVMALRWLWWRVNAWSEVVGMGASIVISVTTWWLPWTRHWWAPDTMEEYFGPRMICIMLASLVAWLIATWLTDPVPAEVLDRFYIRVRPPGWWGPVRTRLGIEPSVGVIQLVTCWGTMAVSIFALLIGSFKLSFGDFLVGGPTLVLGLLATGFAIALARSMYGDTASS